MKRLSTPDWNRIRKRLQKSAIVLILGILILFKVVDYFVGELHSLMKQVEEQRIQVARVEKELDESKKEVDQNKHRIVNLLDEISVKEDEAKKLRVKNKNLRADSFADKLAGQIQNYFKTVEPNRSVKAINYETLIAVIKNAMYYDGVYSKKNSQYKDSYNWKVTMKIFYIETGYELDPPQGPRTELGIPQILEYDYVKDKKTKKTVRVLQLYNLLKYLGYKKESYHATIWAYRTSPKIQVHCFYEWYTRKLNDCNGDFAAAVVAYNTKQSMPRESMYWASYLKASQLLQGWVNKATTEMERAENHE